MQKIWFIFNFTTLALLIWDVINASPRQLISLCRKLSPPFHQNSVTLAPVRTVVMQLGYRGNPKVLIFFLSNCGEVEVFIPQATATARTFFVSFKKRSWRGGHMGVPNLQNTPLINSSICDCACIFSLRAPAPPADWLLRILLYCKLEVFQSCPLGKGIFVKGNLYKWGMRAWFHFKRELASFRLLRRHFPSHTYKRRRHGCTFSPLALPFYSPNSDCEMTQYFNQLYLICTPAEDRATCVPLLPWLALSMPTGCLWAAPDCHACQSRRPTRRVRLQIPPPSSSTPSLS